MNDPVIDRVIRPVQALPTQPPPIAASRPLPDAVLQTVAVLGAGEAQAVPAESLQKAANRMEEYVRSVGRSLQFRVDDSSGRIVVSVRDQSTGELIRQIPSESALRIAEQIESGQPPVSSVFIEGEA